MPQAEKTLLFTGIRASIVTVSDRVSAGKTEDLSGPAITNFLKMNGAEILSHMIVPDEYLKIQSAVLEAIRDQDARLVITAGGTGLSPETERPRHYPKFLINPSLDLVSF